MIPFVQIDPTYASVPAIAAGAYDSYLRSYADSVRNFGHPVVLGFAHEMNGPWYPWGYGHVPPSTFIAAWRHIVTLFRGQGADNVTWLWTVNADRYNTGPIASWWPGRDMSPGSASTATTSIRPIPSPRSSAGPSIRCGHSPESRCSCPRPRSGQRVGQFAKIGDLFAGMHQYKTLGLVWFDKAQHHGIYHQDWRIEDNTAAEEAFRLGVSALTLCTAEPGSPDSC